VSLTEERAIYLELDRSWTKMARAKFIRSRDLSSSELRYD
jgi:hypothetical protein